MQKLFLGKEEVIRKVSSYPYRFHFFASCYSRAYKKWFWCYFSFNHLDLQKESDLTDLMMDAIKQGLEGLVVKDLQVIT